MVNRWCFLMAVAGVSRLGYADVVKLRSGSVLHGEIHEMKKGQLVMTVPELKRVQMRFDAVTGMDTSRVLYLKLQDERIIPAKIDMQGNRVMVGIYVPPVDQKVGEMQTSRGRIEALSENAPQEFRSEWDGNVMIGGDYRTGNSRRKEIDSSLMAQLNTYHFEKIDSQLNITLEYDFLKSNGTLPTNDGYEQVWYAKYFGEQWNVYGQEKLSFSKQESLSLRVQVEAGPGYRIIHKPWLKVNFRVGFGRIDSFYSTNPRTRVGYFAFMPTVIVLAKHKGFTLTNYTWSALSTSNKGGALVYADSRISFPIDACRSMVLRNEIDFNSQPAAGRRKLDNKTTLNLMYSF